MSESVQFFICLLAVVVYTFIYYTLDGTLGRVWAAVIAMALTLCYGVATTMIILGCCA